MNATQTTDSVRQLFPELERIWGDWGECLDGQAFHEMRSGGEHPQTLAATEASNMTSDVFTNTALEIATSPASSAAGLKRKLALLKYLDQRGLEPWYWTDDIVWKLLDSATEDIERLAGGKS